MDEEKIDQQENEEKDSQTYPTSKPPPRPPEIGDMAHPFSQLTQNTYVTYTLLTLIGVIFLIQYGQQTGTFGTFDIIWRSCYNGSKIGQGKTNACKFLQENPAVAEELNGKLREILLAKPVLTPETEEQDGPAPE